MPPALRSQTHRRRAPGSAEVFPQPQSAHPCRCLSKWPSHTALGSSSPSLGPLGHSPCPLPSQPWPHSAVKPLSLCTHTCPTSPPQSTSPNAGAVQHLVWRPGANSHKVTRAHPASASDSDQMQEPGVGGRGCRYGSGPAPTTHARAGTGQPCPAPPTATPPFHRPLCPAQLTPCPHARWGVGWYLLPESTPTGLSGPRISLVKAWPCIHRSQWSPAPPASKEQHAERVPEGKNSGGGE